MFIGEYTHSIDDKGRLAVPAKFRPDLSKGAVVTRGLDNALVIYPMDEWQKLATKLSELPMSQANSRAFSRLMLSGAMDVELDKQGRISIPEYLRKFGSITKKVVLTGLYNRIEIWDEAKWDVYRTQTEADSNSIAEELGELAV